MKKQLTLLFALLLAFVWIGCGGGNKTNLPATEEGEIPEWFLNVPSDPNFEVLYAARTSTSRDLQTAMDKATTDARAEIARQVELQVQGLQKNFIEETGLSDDSELLSQFTQATKTVVNQSISGSRVTKSKPLKDGNTWRAYVLVEYPLSAARKLLANQIKANEQLYTRFRSSETFKELEKEIEKLNQQGNN